MQPPPAVWTSPDPSRPVCPLRRDGRPISEAAVDRALTTQAILDEERTLIAWADRRRADEPVHTRARTTGYGEELTPAQAEAVVAVAGSWRLGADRRSGRYRQDHHARLRRRQPRRPGPSRFRCGTDRRRSRSPRHRDRHGRRHPGQAAHRASHPTRPPAVRLRPPGRDAP